MFAFLVSVPSMAKDDIHIMKLKTEMLRLISTSERDNFTEVTEELKDVCQKNGNEQSVNRTGFRKSNTKNHRGTYFCFSFRILTDSVTGVSSNCCFTQTGQESCKYCHSSSDCD